MSCLSQISSHKAFLPLDEWMENVTMINVGYILCRIVMTFCPISIGMSHQNLNSSLQNHEIPPSIILNIKPLLILNYKKIVDIRWVKAKNGVFSHWLKTLKILNLIIVVYILCSCQQPISDWTLHINSGQLIEPDNCPWCPDRHPTPPGALTN